MKNKMINGWVLIDKPTGITSTDVVRRLKKALKTRKIGHAGTLDPLATGMLPIAIGEATKTIPYILNSEKDYVVTAKWGSSTTTDDREGDPLKSSDTLPTKKEIQNSLPNFTGKIAQTPPIYSAIHVNGQRAYKLAREGKEVKLNARMITINDLKILSYDNDRTSLYVHCSKGTYIRSLIRDIGEEIGCLGHVYELRRLNVGPFEEKMMFSLSQVEEIVYDGDPFSFLHPPQVALDGISVLSLSDEQRERIKLGQKLDRGDFSPGTYQVLEEDKLVALVEVDQDLIRPKKGFNL